MRWLDVGLLYTWLTALVILFGGVVVLEDQGYERAGQVVGVVGVGVIGAGILYMMGVL